MKPVLLLIPGMLNNALVWSDVIEALDTIADVRVAEVVSQSSIADMRRDAWSRLQDVPASTPVVLAGFSMGGYVVIDMLAHSERRITGVALLSSSCLPESREGLINREKSLKAIQFDFSKFVEGVLKWSTHSASPAMSNTLRQMMLDIGSETAQRQVRAIMSRSDHRALLQTLALPVRILCGLHDRVTPPALSETLANSIPGAHLHRIEHAGHMLPFEQPGAVIEVLKDLLNGKP